MDAAVFENELREKFWRALGIEERRDRHDWLYACYHIGSDLVPWQEGEGWLDPHDKRVTTDVLLDGLERLLAKESKYA